MKRPTRDRSAFYLLSQNAREQEDIGALVQKKSRTGISVGAANGYRINEYPREEIAGSLCLSVITLEVQRRIAREDYVVCGGGSELAM